jgi:hypothetical protein
VQPPLIKSLTAPSINQHGPSFFHWPGITPHITSPHNAGEQITSAAIAKF